MTRRRQRRRSTRHKNKYVAAFLALFFGMFGVHKFYLERSTEGMLFVFLFFMFVNIFEAPLTAILGIIDAFRLFFMSNEEFDAKYNNATETRSRRSVPRQRSVSQAPVRTSRRVKRKNPFKISGEKKYEDYDVKGAIKDFNLALDVAPDDSDLHYKLAKAYSINENKEKGYYHLSQAVSLGLKNTEGILNEDDFAYLRIQSEWEAFKDNGYKVIPVAFRPKQEEVKDDRLLKQLNKLADLRKKGLLSEKEFIQEKEKIMRR